jgi:hypothetical protein
MYYVRKKQWSQHQKKMKNFNPPGLCTPCFLPLVRVLCLPTDVTPGMAEALSALSGDPAATKGISPGVRGCRSE